MSQTAAALIPAPVAYGSTLVLAIAGNRRVRTVMPNCDID